MALSVPLSRFTSRVGGGSAFYVSRSIAFYEEAPPSSCRSGPCGDLRRSLFHFSTPCPVGRGLQQKPGDSGRPSRSIGRDIPRLSRRAGEIISAFALSGFSLRSSESLVCHLFGSATKMGGQISMTANHALQRTAAGHRGCNRRALWPPSLSLGR